MKCRSHGSLRSGVEEAGELILDDSVVGDQVRIVFEFLLEHGLSFELGVHENVVCHCNHDTVANRDTIARNKAGLVASELGFNSREELTPLSGDQFLELGVLGRPEAHRHDDPCVVADKRTPRVDNPVDFSNLPPVIGIVVTVLHTETSQNRTRLLHLDSLV